MTPDRDPAVAIAAKMSLAVRPVVGNKALYAEIVAAACRVAHVELDDFFSDGRTEETVLARQMCSYFLRQRHDMGLARIARVIGKNHTTVLTQLRTVKRRLDNGDPRYVNAVAAMERELGSA